MSFARTLTLTSAAGSLLLSGGLWVSYVWYGSALALAQAADSLVDVLTAVVLAWAVRVAAQPGDARHPFGHRSAEPLAAMLVAAMAAVLAFRVGSRAVEILLTERAPEPGMELMGAFVVKAAFRGGLMVAILRADGRERGPAVDALWVDARNDVVLACASVLGVAVARQGYPLADAALALPVALWIGWSGVELGLENTRLLMGEAPPTERQQELLECARSVPGIRGAHDLRAQYVGRQLSVHLHVVLDPSLSLQAAHDLGEAVRLKLEGEDDVDRCEVHLDVAAPSGAK